MNKKQIAKGFAVILSLCQLVPHSVHAQNKKLSPSKSLSTGSSTVKIAKLDEAERGRQAQIKDFARKILSLFYVDCGDTFYITPDYFGLNEVKSSSQSIKPKDVLLFSSQKIEFEDPSPLELFKDPNSTRKYKVITYLIRGENCYTSRSKSMNNKHSKIIFTRILDYNFGSPSEWNYYFNCSSGPIRLPTLEIKIKNGSPYLYDIDYTFFHRTEFRPNKYSIIDYIKEYVNNGGQFIIPKNYCSSPIRADKIIKNHIGWIDDW